MGLVADLIKRQWAESDRQAELSRINEARDRAMAIAELRALQGTRPDASFGAYASEPTDQGFTFQLAPPRPAAVRDLDMQFALQDGGLDPHTSAKASGETDRSQAFRQVIDRFSRGEQPAPSLLNFINSKTVGPRYSASNAGVLDQNSGALQESSYLNNLSLATEALTAERNANAAVTNMRGRALQSVLADPATHPAIRADAANLKPIASSSRVKVRGADGKPRYVDATRNLDGSYSYVPSTMPDGAPVLAENGTRQDENIRSVMRIYGITERQAADLVLNRKGKSPKDAYADYVALAARSTITGLGANVEAVRRYADNLFQIAFPGEPIPQHQPAAAPAPAPAPAAAPAPAPAPAAAGGSGETREWQGATYTVGQLISIGGLDHVVNGFFPDGEPDVSPIRAPQAN